MYTNSTKQLIMPTVKKEKIKTKITSNLLETDETQALIKDTLSFLENILKKTLGPYGSTTIIQDRMLNHTMTKDGYTVLKNIVVKEDGPRTILDTVQRISRNLVRKVGDGSTSSIIVANSLYNALITSFSKFSIPPKDMMDALSLLADKISEEIKNRAIPLSEELTELKHIAAVSTNNDNELGNIIMEVFQKVGKYGFVSIEKSKNEKTYYNDTRGFEIPRGYVSKKMVNKGDEKTAEWSNPFVFMCDSYLGEEDMAEISELVGTVCLKFKTPLVILCKGLDSSMEAFILANFQNTPDLPLLIVDVATSSKQSSDRFEDLALNLGCTPYRKTESQILPEIQEVISSMLGTCLTVTADEKNTRFIQGGGNKELIKERITALEERLEEYIRTEGAVLYDTEIYDIRKRLALLQNNMATIYVGGTTENEKETIKFLVEDAVFACKSAIKFGYVKGGNLIVPQIIHESKDSLLKDFPISFENEEFLLDLINSVYEAFLLSFDTVLSNKYHNDDIKVECILKRCIEEDTMYNLKTDEYEDNVVINSAETDIEILKSAVSIIGLLVTSNQLLVMNLRMDDYGLNQMR